jgi:hypothetical protein
MRLWPCYSRAGDGRRSTLYFTYRRKNRPYQIYLMDGEVTQSGALASDAMEWSTIRYDFKEVEHDCGKQIAMFQVGREFDGREGFYGPHPLAYIGPIEEEEREADRSLSSSPLSFLDNEME